MRIASYNIMDGGTGRADPLAEVLLAQRPDVVVLVEATDPEVADRVAARLGMDLIVARGTGPEDESGAVAVLTKLPMRVTVNHGLLLSDGPRACVEARIATPSGELVLFALHLRARATIGDEARRLAQIEPVLALAEPLRTARRPHVLVGDFNADSSHAVIDLGRVKDSTRRAADEQGGIPRDVITRIERAGYVDSLRAANPEAARVSHTFTTRQPGQRVDYLFARDVGIRHAWVETDRLAEFASDHFPIGAELMWA